ncbi:MAG: hypothetical protein KJ939_08100 [Nanoarchaeota archaeon]|nr:hypothetical protein [Nanoarchaeota archaeon]
MRVCYFGTYESDDSRNILLMKALEKNNIEVIPAHMSYWKFKRAGMNKYMLFMINWFNNLKLFYKYFFKVGKHDLIILGSPGEKDINFARFLAFIKRKKIVLDTYPSINSKKINKLDLLLVDTNQKAKYLSDKLNIKLNKFKVVPYCAEINEIDKEIPKSNFIVNVFGDLSHKSFNLLLKIKQDIKKDIELNLIKVKPKKESQVKNPKSLVAKTFNVVKKFLPEKKVEEEKENPNYKYISEEELKQTILASNLCLVFDDKNNLENSLPKEAIEVLALNRPLLIKETIATKEAFPKGALFYQDDLIKTLNKIKKDKALLEKVSFEGNELFKEKYSIKQVGNEFSEVLENLLKNNLFQ